MLIQPSVFVRPSTLAHKSTLQEPHYLSGTWGRITVPLLEFPVEIRPVTVRAACVVIREPNSSQSVAYSCYNPFFDARTPDLLK